MEREGGWRLVVNKLRKFENNLSLRINLTLTNEYLQD